MVHLIAEPAILQFPLRQLHLQRRHYVLLMVVFSLADHRTRILFFSLFYLSITSSISMWHWQRRNRWTRPSLPARLIQLLSTPRHFRISGRLRTWITCNPFCLLFFFKETINKLDEICYFPEGRLSKSFLVFFFSFSVSILSSSDSDRDIGRAVSLK